LSAWPAPDPGLEQCRLRTTPRPGPHTLARPTRGGGPLGGAGRRPHLPPPRRSSAGPPQLPAGGPQEAARAAWGSLLQDGLGRCLGHQAGRGGQVAQPGHGHGGHDPAGACPGDRLKTARFRHLSPSQSGPPNPVRCALMPAISSDLGGGGISDDQQPAAARLVAVPPAALPLGTRLPGRPGRKQPGCSDRQRAEGQAARLLCQRPRRAHPPSAVPPIASTGLLPLALFQRPVGVPMATLRHGWPITNEPGSLPPGAVGVQPLADGDLGTL
jgi:hypothetical protein